MHESEDLRGNVIRDLTALNKIEVEPWDVAELMDQENNPIYENSKLFNTIAELTTSTYDRLAELQAIYQKHVSLQMPGEWEP